MLGVQFGEVVEGCLGCRSTPKTEVSDCLSAEEVISRRDHFILAARDLSGTLALNEFSSTAREEARPTNSGHQGKSKLGAQKVPRPRHSGTHFEPCVQRADGTSDTLSLSHLEWHGVWNGTLRQFSE